MSEVMSIPAIYKDTLVRQKGKAQIFRVKRLNAKSVTVVDVAGHEWKLPCPTEAAWNMIEEVAFDSREAELFRSQEFTSTTFFYVGNVVRWPGCKHTLGRGLLVVTRVNADGDCNLSPLGGTNTQQFFRSVPAVNLVKADGEAPVTNA